MINSGDGGDQELLKLLGTDKNLREAVFDDTPLTSKNCPGKSGRWSEYETKQFLEAYKRFGKDWVRVQ